MIRDFSLDETGTDREPTLVLTGSQPLSIPPPPAFSAGYVPDKFEPEVVGRKPESPPSSIPEFGLNQRPKQSARSPRSIEQARAQQFQRIEDLALQRKRLHRAQAFLRFKRRVKAVFWCAVICFAGLAVHKYRNHPLANKSVHKVQLIAKKVTNLVR